MSVPPNDPLLERPEPRRRWMKPVLALVILAVVLAGAWYFFGRGESAAPAATAPAKGGAPGKGGAGGRRGGFDPNRAQPVAAAAARVGDINVVQTALGTVTAGRVVVVKPRVDGQLQSIAFDEGQLVKENQVLATIDPAPLQVALAQAEGQLARDAAQLNNARLDLDRYKGLLAQDSIAAQQVDQQAALVRQLEGTVKVDQAAVDSAKLQLSYTRITAPISGRLGLRLVDPGNMVRQSDPSGIAVITQVDPIAVLFTIPQDTLPRVLQRLRSGEKPAVEAWDKEGKNLLARGKLVTTDNQIDVATGTVRLKAEFPNPQGALFPNQFVNVRMVVDTRRGVVVVPTAAVQRGAQGTLVYVVRDDSTVALRPVQVGATEGANTQVESGLQAGERVITDGVDRIREGAKVEVTEPGAGLRQRPAAPPAGTAREPKKAASPTDAPAPAGSADAEREAFKKRLESMDPEKRARLMERLKNMTPEEREAFKQRRREGREAGGAPQ